MWYYILVKRKGEIKMKRILTQELYVKIRSEGIWVNHYSRIPDIIYFEKIKYENEEQCQDLLSQAYSLWEKISRYERPQEPELIKYWLTIDIKE
jgi:hypothetical protein